MVVESRVTTGKTAHAYGDAMRYFAFVKRDQDGRCTATFPDLPGLVVRSRSFRRLQKRLGPAARQHFMLQPVAPAPLERLQSLPRSEDDLDGFWLEVQV